MIRWIIIIVLFYLIWRVLKGLIGTNHENETRPKKSGETGDPEDLVQDPVSGVYFPRSQGVASRVDGKVLYFVNTETRDQYIRSRRSGNNGGKG